MAHPKNLRNNNLKSLFKWPISKFKKHSRVMKIMQKENTFQATKNLDSAMLVLMRPDWDLNTKLR